MATNKKSHHPNGDPLRFAYVTTAASGASTGADRLFETMVAATVDRRRLNSLISLKRALDVMRQTNAREYSIAAVARGILALGFRGPKEQSIRNAEGEEFRELIAAFADECQVSPKHRPDEEFLVERIADHSTAARVQLIINQNKALQRRNDILHAQYQRLSAVELTVEGANYGVNTSRTQFSEMEVNAVRKFLSSVVDLLDCSFDPDTGALIRDRTNVEVGPPGLHQAMLKVVGDSK